MELFKITTQAFAQQITRHRRLNYSEQTFQMFFSNNPQIKQQRFAIRNASQQLLDCLLCKSNANETSTAIVYAHGLGSNKLQIISILKRVQQMHYDILAFDFSGNGKSEGDYCTFGIKQKQDIQCVLKFALQKKSYSNIFLWGRSMGAVSIILHQAQQKYNQKIKGVILDSPFCSFERVAIQMAIKQSILPQFVLTAFLIALKDYFKNNMVYNPFDIQLEKQISKIRANIFIIYSKNDSIVSHQHSMKLMKACKRIPYTFQINEDHNISRRRQTYGRILKFIQDCLKQHRRNNRSCSRAKGINLTPKSRKTGVFSSLPKNSSSIISVQRTKKTKQDREFCKYRILSHRNSHAGIQNTISSINPQNTQRRFKSFEHSQISQSLILDKYSRQKIFDKQKYIKNSVKCQLHQQKNIKNLVQNSISTKTGSPKFEETVIYEEVKTQCCTSKIIRNFRSQCRNSTLRPTINLIRKSRIHLI